MAPRVVVAPKKLGVFPIHEWERIWVSLMMCDFVKQPWHLSHSRGNLIHKRGPVSKSTTMDTHLVKIKPYQHH